MPEVPAALCVGRVQLLIRAPGARRLSAVSRRPRAFVSVCLVNERLHADRADRVEKVARPHTGFRRAATDAGQAAVGVWHCRAVDVRGAARRRH